LRACRASGSTRPRPSRRHASSASRLR